MAYADRQTGAQRATTLAIAGIVNATIGAVLIVGLAPPLIDIIKPPPPIDTFDVKEKKIPPPEQPTEDAKKPDSTVTAPEHKIEVQQQETVKPADPIDYPPLPPVPTAGEGQKLAVNLPPIPKKALFTPRGPRPANAQSRWVTTDDYPSGDIRGEHTGTSRYRVVVSSKGTVTSCEIVQSSGWPGLDKAACANVSKRAKFEPGIDENGAKAVGTYSGSVIWQIPE